MLGGSQYSDPRLNPTDLAHMLRMLIDIDWESLQRLQTPVPMCLYHLLSSIENAPHRAYTYCGLR
jgi:hypothetical protein